MARDILLHTLLKRDLNVIAVLAKYRRIRERLGDEQIIDFEPALIAQTATATANSPDSVRSIVSEWVERRPLRYLAACRYPGLSPTVCRFAAQRENPSASSRTIRR